MSEPIHLCVVGAGSSYTPELLAGVLEHDDDELGVREIRMQDIHGERLAVMDALARRMVRHRGRRIEVRADTDLQAMLDGCRFVVTQIRVGGMAARHLDESIPPKYGLLGQETTGPGGMFKALRTIPPMLEIARAVEAAAPDAFILNYTNPSGIITEAVRRHTGAKLIGLCSGIPGIRARLAELLAGDFPNLRTYCVGLNHLGFVHRFVDDGRDVTDAAIDRLLEMAATRGDHPDLARPDLIRLLRAVPIGYAEYYFHRGEALRHLREAAKTRAETVMAIEQRVFAEAVDPATVTKPGALAERGGGGYSDITLEFIKAIAHDRPAELACTVRNDGAVEGIDDDAGVEVVCRVDAQGARPIPVGPIPPAVRGLIQAVKAYETLTVAAAVHRRRDLAVQALANHPLAGDLDVIEPLVDEMLAAHGLDYQ